MSSPKLKHGIYQPPTAELVVDGTVFEENPAQATIESIELTAGATIGSAIVAKRCTGTATH